MPYVGGGFGGKAGINLEPIAVALAMRCRGRWVRLMVDRHEEFFATVVRQGLTATLVTGVDRSGKVQAQKMHYLWNCGAYGGYGVNIVRAAGYTCGGAYEFPNVEGDSIGVYTNRPVGSAYRGFGMQEIHWALEQQMDKVALEIGMDPVEFRLLNCLGAGKSTVTGQVLDEHSGRVDLCIRKVADEIGMDPTREKTPVPRQGDRLRREGAGDAERRRLVGRHEVRRGRDARDPHLGDRLRPGADDRRGAVRGGGARHPRRDDPREGVSRHRPLAVRLADGRLAPDLGDRERGPARRPRRSGGSSATRPARRSASRRPS